MSDVPLIKQFLQHQGQFMAYLMAITRDLNAAEEIFQNAAVVVMDDTAKNRTELESAALRGCVRELASSERLLLQLRYTQRASFATIGKTVGKTDGAVQPAVSRIRKRLHDCVLGKIQLSETTS